MESNAIIWIVGGVVVAIGVILAAKKAIDDMFVSRKDFEQCQKAGKEAYLGLEEKVDSLRATQVQLILAVCRANSLNPEDFIK